MRPCEEVLGTLWEDSCSPLASPLTGSPELRNPIVLSRMGLSEAFETPEVFSDVQVLLCMPRFL